MAPTPPQGQSAPPLPLFSREEVGRHKKPGDCWIVIHGDVYDVTRWLDRHPGGRDVLQHYGGEDATVAFECFHNDKSMVRKYMTPFLIGHIVPEETELPEVSKDFLNLKTELERKGLFKTNPWFFVAHFAHITLCMALAWLVLWWYGNSWLPWLTAAVLFVTGQAQAGWLQHDFGHLTVFNNTRLNHLVHDVTIGLMKGVSSYWWNLRHYQHHAKPNVFLKDPDITIPFVFLLGKVIPEKWGKKHWGKLPYGFQHYYFFFVGPPMLLPVYFHVEVLFYCLLRKKWKDIILMLCFYAVFHLMFAALLGGFWANFRFYFFIRFLESHWFVWATQISHLPMDIDTDKRNDWVTMQLQGTCNVEQSWLNDWFLGHLNFQIEHHLFPTMPRHNFHAAQPYAMELCRKHGIRYQLKPVFTAFADIIRSLKQSGNIWREAWECYSK